MNDGMHLSRNHMENYAPIHSLDTRFPFDDERSKPQHHVGERGSDKSIVLSHTVNEMISTKDACIMNLARRMQGIESLQGVLNSLQETCVDMHEQVTD